MVAGAVAGQASDIRADPAQRLESLPMTGSRQDLASVSVVQDYLAAPARGDVRGAGDLMAEDLTYVAPGRNRLAGVRHGRDAAASWFAEMGTLSDGSYRVIASLDWSASDTAALLLAREHARVAGTDRDWTRAIRFDVADGVVHRVQLFEDDQYGDDAWLGGPPRGADGGPADEPAPDGPPQMAGDLDDPRVRAVLSYQRQLAAGDLASARTIFWPDVTYTVPGRSRLAGTYRGPDEVMGYLGSLVALTDGSYAISRMHWLTSADRVGLATRNHATRGGRSPTWDELIVFTFVDGRKKDLARRTTARARRHPPDRHPPRRRGPRRPGVRAHHRERADHRGPRRHRRPVRLRRLLALTPVRPRRRSTP
jgi:hypothetical protein